MKREAMPSDYEKEIGARVAALMESRGYTFASLAEAMGWTSHSSARKLVAGENVYQWTLLAKLAKLLETSPDHLLGAAGATGLDEKLVQAAVQGLLEQLGFERQMAQIGARLAVEAAQEHRALLEDPETEVRLRIKLAAADAGLTKSKS